ncbi:EscU/YscU/HrcU family type III secretion system export apparatus switch protein [Leeia sp. TBRC 13508]|uniref:EscU/YscU/HrcU family type III secretion system export apparatus switch protein n=1 Tax=Leeia speluncae TaxID=2884804 RepID=A0ABS8D892_9NEIS|nr:EscU/YscU/HrcU family type III secretion system export apparatus switch protein [Leeia speluncae]MCB6184228.1 EscU/YscU/HrcU family type III secretion system export apparatus switch protein [Leeia speluncae]
MADESEYRPSVNPLAVAISYSAGEVAAPQVVAKGRGLIAEAIIAQAKAAGVFVHESKELVALLMQVDLDQHIPPELYRAVAEILAFVYLLEHGSTMDAATAVLGKAALPEELEKRPPARRTPQGTSPTDAKPTSSDKP